MNREARRRQEKFRKQGGGIHLSRELQSMFLQAVSYHKAAQFAQAESLYQQILDQSPHHPDSLHLLGLTYYQRGNISDAGKFISQAISHDDTKPLYHFNLGLVLEKIGQLPDAIKSYKKALQLKPTYIEAQSNLGQVYRKQGKLNEAIQAFESVLRIKPDSAEAHNNLGVVYKEQGQLDDAVAQYRAALQANPSHAEAFNNLGIALKERGNFREAEAAFRQALSCKPQYAKAHHHLGLTLLWQQQNREALDSFTRSAELTHHHGQPIQKPFTTPARIKHDLEQIQYLQRHGIVSNRSSEYLHALKSIREQAQTEHIRSGFISLTPQLGKALSPSFNTILHRGIAEALPEGALNPNLDVASIESQYHASYPEIMFLDELLTTTALTNLRQYCLESTIWKKDYQNGYLGTFLAEGFACPLLLQIAEELRLRFPGIFKNHLLSQAWAFKYDSELQGLNLHADAAAVNVNFWITPDEANLDQTSGGLVVWDKEAPDEWDFHAYNNDSNKDKVRDFLERNHAQAVTVPHRQNRALIFNSNLFHETDTISFKDDYEHRRINVTLLYGYRQQARNPQQ